MSKIISLSRAFLALTMISFLGACSMAHTTEAPAAASEQSIAHSCGGDKSCCGEKHSNCGDKKCSGDKKCCGEKSGSCSDKKCGGEKRCEGNKGACGGK